MMNVLPQLLLFGDNVSILFSQIQTFPISTIIDRMRDKQHKVELKGDEPFQEMQSLQVCVSI